jgi:hypothetical protein
MLSFIQKRWDCNVVFFITSTLPLYTSCQTNTQKNNHYIPIFAGYRQLGLLDAVQNNSNTTKDISNKSSTNLRNPSKMSSLHIVIKRALIYINRHGPGIEANSKKMLERYLYGKEKREKGIIEGKRALLM